MTKYENVVETAASGGCIRFGHDGVYLHQNSSHDSVGIRDLYIDTEGRLVVKHSAPGPVVTMSANADETLSARSITLGCSGGGGTTTITVSKLGKKLNLRDPDDYKLVAGTYSNAWLFWLHCVS